MIWSCHPKSSQKHLVEKLELIWTFSYPFGCESGSTYIKECCFWFTSHSFCLSKRKQTKKTDKLTDIFITSGVLPLQTVDDEMYVEGFNQKTATKSCRQNHTGYQFMREKKTTKMANYRKWCRMGGKRVVLHRHNHNSFSEWKQYNI